MKKKFLIGVVFIIFLMLLIPATSSMQISQQTNQTDEKTYNRTKDFGFHILNINVYSREDSPKVDSRCKIYVNNIYRQRMFILNCEAFAIVFTNNINVRIVDESFDAHDWQYSECFDLTDHGVFVRIKAFSDTKTIKIG